MSGDEMSGTKCPPFHYYIQFYFVFDLFFTLSLGNDRASVPTDYSRGRVLLVVVLALLMVILRIVTTYQDVQRERERKLGDSGYSAPFL